MTRELSGEVIHPKDFSEVLAKFNIPIGEQEWWLIRWGMIAGISLLSDVCLLVALSSPIRRRTGRLPFVRQREDEMNIGQMLLQVILPLHPGNFLIIDLITATTNALNGVLLASRPDYYLRNQWTIVGLLLLAIFGGIGGGVTRDVLLSKIPGAITDPWYLILCLTAGVVGIIIANRAYAQGQKFRERAFSFMTSFSLPWYATIGVQAGLSAHLPGIACVLLGAVGPTAGRYLIDITAGKTAKQFVRGEWFVGTAVLTSLAYLVLALYLGLSIWPATLIAFAIGFAFREAALWFGWEEPMPRYQQAC